MSVSKTEYEMCHKSHCNCIVCGSQNPVSLGLAFDVNADGTVSSQFRGSALLQGYEGILHGGIIAALLDASMTHCLFHLGIEAVTGTLDVRFVKPVPCDALLTVRASLTDAHRPLYKLKSVLTCDHRVMARARASFMRTKSRD
jgi:acyl-coenzyme A thioesterase PaaI-like protein